MTVYVSPTMATVIIVTEAASSTNGRARQGTNGLYIAGVVIGTIALLISSIALVICLLCIRKRGRQLDTKRFRDFCPLLRTSKLRVEKVGDPEAVDEKENEKKNASLPVTPASAMRTTSCWPKYKRISPPAATRSLPVRPTPAKLRTCKSDSSFPTVRQARPQLQVDTSQLTYRQPVPSMSNPLNQHPVQAPPPLDFKGKGRASEACPIIPPKSPLRASKMTFPFPGMRAGSVVSTTVSMEDHNQLRTASSSVDSEQQRSRSITNTHKAIQVTQSESTRSRTSPRSQRSLKAHSRSKVDSVISQASAKESISKSLEDQPSAPVPPLPEVRKKSSRRRKSPSKTSKSVQAKLEQRSQHNRWESGTDIETSDYDTNNESDYKTQSSGGETKEPLATESTSPIADVRYPKVPRGSNSRTLTPVIIPRASLDSSTSLRSMAAKDRASTSTPCRKSIKGHSGVSSRSTTPSTSVTTISPKTPKQSHHSLVSFRPTIISNTPPPKSASPTPLLRSGEFLQNPLYKQHGTWPKTAQQQFVAQPRSVKVARKDLPTSDVYEFF